MNTKRILTPLIGIAMGLGLQGQAQAVRINVTVENLTPEGGLYFTPLWVGFHDGGFDTFDIGAPASASIELVAEGGDVSGLQADFGTVAGGVDGVVTAPAGFGGAPVFDPLDMGSLTLNLDPTANRYFSFASMVIPSNDAFIGNDDPTAYEIFDVTGAFTGPLDILVLGSAIWDAGTELNDGMGAAFSTLGGTGTDEMALIGMHGGLGPLLGTTTAAGTTIDTILGNFTQTGYQLARITITHVPEPQLLAIFGLGFGVMLAARRRRGAGPRLAA